MMLGAGESVGRHAAFAVDAVVLYAGMVALTAHLSDLRVNAMFFSKLYRFRELSARRNVFLLCCSH